MERKSVSVVMATYNGEAYLAEQLRSIVEQSEAPAEVIVADDGSTDATVDLAAEVLAASGLPHRIVRNPRQLGYGENFMRAAELATSTYIAFSDQDDVWHPRKLERVVQAMEEDGSCMAAHHLRRVTTEGVDLGTQVQGIDRRKVLPPLTAEPFGVFFGLSMTFRADLLRLLPTGERGHDIYTFPLTPLAHDRWIYFLATNFGRTSLLPEALVDYRQHGAQQFGSQRVSYLTRFTNKVRDGAPLLQAIADTARERSALVKRHEPGSSTSLIETAAWRGVAERYDRVADLFQKRADLYRSPSVRTRLSEITSLAGAGAYREPELAGLGRRRVLEDVSVGLLRLGQR